MASKDYLFVNKDSRSPSLSRNTGTEASLASRINKHVQQQRFWRTPGPRQSWYRPFVRSNSGSPTPSPTHSEFQTLDDSADFGRRSSVDQRSLKLPRRSASARVDSITSRRASRQHTDLVHDLMSRRDRWPLPQELLSLCTNPGAAVDAFKTIVMPLTPTLVEILQRHMRWAIAASITRYTVEEGVERVFASILQDKMRAAAFLAVATAQQKRTSRFVFPSEQGPELYSYQATKMIREHIEQHKGQLSSCTAADIFRLAVAEWINGNHDAARIHFAYISKLWDSFDPQDAVDYHVWEICSSEDVFLAIDVDEQPLLALNWLPRLPIGPHASLRRSRSLLDREDNSLGTGKAASILENPGAAQQLIDLLRGANSPLTEILRDCIVALEIVPHFQNVDFGSALTGPLWTVKRHLHAALHRLQSLDTSMTSMGDSIRRSLVIILFLASTTSERRLARSDLCKLGERLKSALEGNGEQRSPQSSHETESAHKEMSQSSSLRLWMYAAGLAATRVSLVPCRTRQWFTKRAALLIVRTIGYTASFHDIEKLLSSYLYFDNALGESVAIILAAVEEGKSIR